MAPNLYTSVQAPSKSPKSPPSNKFHDLHLHSQVQIDICNPSPSLKPLVVALAIRFLDAKTTLGVADFVPASLTAAISLANNFISRYVFEFFRAALLALSVLYIYGSIV